MSYLVFSLFDVDDSKMLGRTIIDLRNGISVHYYSEDSLLIDRRPGPGFEKYLTFFDIPWKKTKSVGYDFSNNRNIPRINELESMLESWIKFRVDSEVRVHNRQDGKKVKYQVVSDPSKIE